MHLALKKFSIPPIYEKNKQKDQGDILVLIKTQQQKNNRKLVKFNFYKSTTKDKLFFVFCHFCQ